MFRPATAPIFPGGGRGRAGFSPGSTGLSAWMGMCLDLRLWVSRLTGPSVGASPLLGTIPQPAVFSECFCVQGYPNPGRFVFFFSFSSSEAAPRHRGAKQLVLARLSCGGAAGGGEDTHARASWFNPSRCSLPASVAQDLCGLLLRRFFLGQNSPSAARELLSLSLRAQPRLRTT